MSSYVTVTDVGLCKWESTAVVEHCIPLHSFAGSLVRCTDFKRFCYTE
jgi:hypothetical protein